MVNVAFTQSYGTFQAHSIVKVLWFSNEPCRDFQLLARQFPQHAGIVLAAQRSWQLISLIATLDNLLTQTSAEEWSGQIRWLNEWHQ